MEKFDIEKEYRSAVRNLGTFSLSEYEIRAYISLVLNGYGSAETIAKTACIPRTSAYKVLQSLSGKGFAYTTKGRPTIFKPESPASLKKLAAGRIAETFDRLETLSEMFSERGEPQLVFTITGRERVLKKINEIIDKTEKYLVISTPSFSVLRREIEKKLQNAVKRNVEITLIAEETGRVPEGVKVIRKKEQIATDIVSDGERAFIADSDLEACGYTENPLLAQHVERFLIVSVGR
jgi:sugar-specific transcriptional regulator TrmB